MEKLKVLAIHDADGRIDGFVTSHVDAPSGALVTDAGHAMTEIDLPEAMAESDDADALESLSAVLHRYQTEYLVVREAKASVVRRTALGNSGAESRDPRHSGEDT